MRNLSYIIYVSLAAVITCTGCKKWLDTEPTDRISDTKLFDNAEGFRTALNGVYQQISSPELYGRNLTWGYASALGQDYRSWGIGYDMSTVMELDYTEPGIQSGFSNMWEKAYNTISNCNKIIDELGKKDTTFFPLRTQEKNLILGEAKAMRALLHFEMLRLFAPAPINNRNGISIPYQNQYPSHYNAPLPTNVVMNNIINDLEEAQQLVAYNDTLINRVGMNGSLQGFIGGANVKGGVFFNYRMFRLNYVAIQGLLARVHLYNGDKEKALVKAEYLYKTYSPTAGRLKWWAFTPSWYATGTMRYPKLIDDIIFSGYDPELTNKISVYRSNQTDFYIADEHRSNYPESGRDYRYGLIGPGGASEKWVATPYDGQYHRDQNFFLPVLRFSEIYYIYSETLFDAGRTTEALKVLNAIRQARGKLTTFTDTNPAAFYKELFDEYRREFMVEGQTVFNHKRLNRRMEIGTKIIEVDKRFVFDIPQGEKIY